MSVLVGEPLEAAPAEINIKYAIDKCIIGLFSTNHAHRIKISTYLVF